MKQPTGQRSLEEAFNECVELLLAGRPVDDYLRAHPEQTAKLTPLLETAGLIRRQRTVPPRSPEVAARSRQRFMAAAQSMAAGRRPAPGFFDVLTAWWSGVLAGLAGPRRPAYALAALLIAVMLLGLSATQIITASAEALPGDPLYQVKLISEQVQLTLARDAATREQVEQMIGARRVQEAQAITVLRRPVALLRISGPIEAIADSEWQVAGLALVVTEETKIAGVPEVGARAFVELTAPGDGRLVAVAIYISPAASRSASPAATEAPTAPPTATPEPPSPTPTDTPTAIEPTSATAERGPASEDTPTPTATPTQTWTPTRTPSATPTAGPTLTPPRPTAQTGQYLGTLVGRQDATWIIQDADVVRRVVVTAETVLVGDPQVGDAVQAMWVLKGDVYVATRIAVTRKAGPTLEPMDFLGLIQKLEGEWWTVNHIVFKVTAETEVEGEPAIDRQAEVHAERRPNGEIWARRVVVHALPEHDLSGMIEVVSRNTIVLLGATRKTIYLDDRTQYQGDPPMVGRWADVRALRLADGRLVARILLVYPPTPVPSVTPTRTPRPTRTPTPTNTQHLMPSATPTATHTPLPPSPTATRTPPPSPTLTPTHISSPTPAVTPTPTATVTTASNRVTASRRFTCQAPGRVSGMSGERWSG